jgi:twitching motility protein PilI
MTTHAVSGNTAFNLLLSLEEAVLLNGGAVPKNVDAREQWSGVRCVVAGMNFVMPLHQVGEILEPRALTAIPGCAGWVKGLMNVRGRLLPVFSVSEFFGGPRTRSSSFQIILVEQGATFCGIAVEKVFGIQKFFQDDFSESNAMPEPGFEAIAEFVGASTAVGSDSWVQLDIAALAARMCQANPAATATNDTRSENSRTRPVAVLADTGTAATNIM